MGKITSVLFGLILLLLPMSAGCWDVKDISNQAFVTCIGLDAVSDPDLPGFMDAAEYKLTFEIINPAKLADNSGGPATIIETVEAPSIGKAVEILQSRISRQITLSHLRVLLVGDKLARQKDFTDPADYFEKNAEVALRMRLMFVQGHEARDVLNIKPKQGKSLSDELVALTQIERNTSLAQTNPFNSFMQDLRTTGGRALGSRVLVHENRKILIRSGSAVFNNRKLAGWLDCTETEDANWITRETPAVLQGHLDGLFFTFRADRVKTDIIPEIREGKPFFKIKIKVEGNILEEQGRQIDLSNPENMDKITNTISGVVRKSAAMAISKSQKEFGIDYLGLGQAFNNRYPEAYKNMDWKKVYPDIPVEINVKCTFSKSGLAR